MPEPAKYKLDPRHLLQGITGADHSLPTFDGLSTDPKDHLIDFDTDSMEKHADVRVYFWQVGDELQRLGSEFIARPDLDFILPTSRSVYCTMPSLSEREGSFSRSPGQMDRGELPSFGLS